MCFSATASFATSGFLTVTGGLALWKSKKDTRLFALVPLLFAAQQAIEGIQWLVEKPSTASLALGYGFLAFAFVLWPSFMPAAVYTLEKDGQRKKVMKILFGVGVLASVYLLFVLFTEPLAINVLSHSISYGITIPFQSQLFIFYILPTIGSGILSTRPYVRAFGVLTLLSAIVSYIVFSLTFTSVWCFFAAALSFLVLGEIATTPIDREAAKE